MQTPKRRAAASRTLTRIISWLAVGPCNRSTENRVSPSETPPYISLVTTQQVVLLFVYCCAGIGQASALVLLGKRLHSALTRCLIACTDKNTQSKKSGGARRCRRHESTASTNSDESDTESVAYLCSWVRSL